MNICVVFQLYLAMAQTHVDIAANHVKIADAGKFLQTQCVEFEKKGKAKQEKKIKESKIEAPKSDAK